MSGAAVEALEAEAHAEAALVFLEKRAAGGEIRIAGRPDPHP